MTVENTLPHNSPDNIGRSHIWHGYVGFDNIKGIAERIKRIAEPGRTLIYTHEDGRRVPEVKAGLTFYENSDAWAKGFQLWERDHGCGVGVLLGPGINQFGVSCEAVYDFNTDARIPVTGFDVKQRVERIESPFGRFDWSWIEIHGGLDNGRNRTDDLISIIHENENGYREKIQIIPGDMTWHQHWERDAIAAERLAETLVNTDVDQFHAAYGLSPEERAEAASALGKMAANIRKWRQDLPVPERYPYIDGKWL